MQDSNLKKIRLEKLEKIRELGINPYPAKFEKSHTIHEVQASLGKKIKTAGRLFSFREHGNIAFADLKDETGKIQIFFQKKLLGDAFKKLKLLDIGDFIGVEGEVIKTIAGEVSIAPINYTLLSKSLLPLPTEWFGLKDTETRYRQRYLDLLINNQVRDRFNTRTKLVSGIREYLDTLGFWEVETPTLQPLYGGANAKPFTTHLHALDQNVYLRIADELYLKRLIVGGYERVYEICKDFRNEGIDNTHFPEFTMVEWYEAYADYQIMMDRAEGLLVFLARKIYGKSMIEVGEESIDIGEKWERIPMTEIIKQKLHLDVEKESRETLLTYARKYFPEIALAGEETKGQLIFAIFEHAIPKLLKKPTWIIDYPQDVSPLSKPHRSKPGWVERFEGYVGGKEIFDGWSELTDPQLQRNAWNTDEKVARKDKEEAQHLDEDFLTAMEFGMPPFGGIGVGVDRLAMLLNNTWAIKEVILFPTLRKHNLLLNETTKPHTSQLQNVTVSSVNIPQSKQDFSQKMVIILNNKIERWQAMNAVAHISAYIGHAIAEIFDTGEYFITQDNIKHPRNMQYPIVTLSASASQLKKLIISVRKAGLLYHAFIREMIETSNDNEIQNMLQAKIDENIDYLGIGIFGESENVSALTRNFSLWK